MRYFETKKFTESRRASTNLRIKVGRETAKVFTIETIAGNRKSLL